MANKYLYSLIVLLILSNAIAEDGDIVMSDDEDETLEWVKVCIHNVKSL